MRQRCPEQAPVVGRSAAPGRPDHRQYSAQSKAPMLGTGQCDVAAFSSAAGGNRMAFKFKDLIVTIQPDTARTAKVPCGSSRRLDVDCGSSANFDVDCLDSAEVLMRTPYSQIDPAYRTELRELLLHALAKANVDVPQPNRLEVLEENMKPRTAKDIEKLERRLSAALVELRALKRTARTQARKPRKRSTTSAKRRKSKP